MTCREMLGVATPALAVAVIWAGSALYNAFFAHLVAASAVKVWTARKPISASK
jgi:hypothetical protein